MGVIATRAQPAQELMKWKAFFIYSMDFVNVLFHILWTHTGCIDTEDNIYEIILKNEVKRLGSPARYINHSVLDISVNNFGIVL